MAHMDSVDLARLLDKSMSSKVFFSHLSSKTYVVGTQKMSQ